MLHIICRLYEDGKIPSNGMFDKVASLIVENELNLYKNASNTEKIRKILIETGIDPVTAIEKAEKIVSNKRPAEIRKIIKFLEENKSGGIIDKLRLIPSRLTPVLATGAAALGIGAIKNIYEAYELYETEKKHKAVLEEILKRHPEFDKKKATEIFEALAKVSPNAAEDIAIAEGFVVPHMSWDTLPHPAIKDLATTQKSISQSRPLKHGLFSRVFESIGEAIGKALS